MNIPIDVLVQLVAVIIAGAALFVAWDTARATRQQAKLTEKALIQNENNSKVDTLIHFTNKFFSIVEMDDKPLEEKFKSESWRLYYWNLLSTEFYFYHKGGIPPLMFSLWMLDLAEAYRIKGVWDSHEKYLGRYCVIYDTMKDFFSAIHEQSKIDAKDTRDRKVKEVVEDWTRKFELIFE